MIPSTGPMAADRRCSVAWMMTTTMTADFLLLRAEGRATRQLAQATRSMVCCQLAWLDPASDCETRRAETPPSAATAACGIGCGCATSATDPDSCQPIGGAPHRSRTTLDDWNPRVRSDRVDQRWTGRPETRA
ncbi:hypothetical protein ALC60_10563 [Trachymyrmex zeteki]|uniref:Uncharacterized protein n=1 Tax=Mycetomoellerius zeteki TaxID=64791 RepID=A0A151WR16_9HYME|nr:hypothetical protein ALC60_10563 [Trachymyrmex zeteki]